MVEDGSMKTISRLDAQQKSVTNVLASLRIEQLTPRPSVIEGLRTYIAGKTSTDNLLAEVVNHHVAIRRV